MTTAERIIEFLKGKGPEYVVNTGMLDNIGSTSKTINKALERLADRGTLERVARGYYKLAKQADPVKVARNYAKAMGTSNISPIGGLCYRVLGLTEPLDSLKNTFTSYDDKMPIRINGETYNIRKGRWGSYRRIAKRYTDKVDAALKILEIEIKNLHLILPLIRFILTEDELKTLSYNLKRSPSTNLINDPMIKNLVASTT